jgi:aminopeptidase
LADPRVEKYAQILVDYSTKVKPGDLVAIHTSTAAEELIQVMIGLILERGAFPHVILDVANQEELYYTHATDELLDFVPKFHKMAFEEFDVLFKIRCDTNTRALSQVDPARQSRRQKALSPLLVAQMRRGADNSLRWMSTHFPNQAYAMEAEMGLEQYKNFFYRACHADEGTPDPVAHWQGIERQQQRLIDFIQGHDQVRVLGPNADLTLSIKGRTFMNACGTNNLPDGEIYTGPVENSANGWVRFTYPAIHQGRAVEGIELTFEEGKVVQATAKANQDFLLRMLDSDPGARYLGEFAIGTNYEIDRFTRSILFDEKIGGSFHMAVGAGYPETGSVNKSVIHWDMICDMRQDSEIQLDGEVIYRNGQFTI